MDAAGRETMARVREADRDRYVSALYAPEEKRPALFALYAFDAELAAVRGRVREALAGEIRIQWWRDAVGDASGGQGAGNPVAETLHRAIETHRLPRAAFEPYFDARIADLYDDVPPNRETLEAWCGGTASTVMQMALLILDAAAAPRFAEASGHGGCAQALVRLIQSLPRDRARGRCVFPQDMLAATGVSEEEVLAGQPSALPALRAFAALARDHFSAFVQAAGEMPASLRPAFLPLAVTGELLAKIERRDDLLERPVTIGDLRRQWLILRRAGRDWR